MSTNEHIEVCEIELNPGPSTLEVYVAGSIFEVSEVVSETKQGEVMLTLVQSAKHVMESITDAAGLSLLDFGGPFLMNHDFPLQMTVRTTSSEKTKFKVLFKGHLRQTTREIENLGALLEMPSLNSLKRTIVDAFMQGLDRRRVIEVAVAALETGILDQDCARIERYIEGAKIGRSIRELWALGLPLEVHQADAASVSA